MDGKLDQSVGKASRMSAQTVSALDINPRMLETIEKLPMQTGLIKSGKIDRFDKASLHRDHLGGDGTLPVRFVVAFCDLLFDEFN